MIPIKVSIKRLVKYYLELGFFDDVMFYLLTLNDSNFGAENTVPYLVSAR